MRVLFFIIILCLILPLEVICQHVKIKEILDANLFKLTDGRVVKLAGVDASSCSSSIPYLREVADDAKNFAQDYINYRMLIDSVSFDTSGNFLLAFLYRNYPLEKVSLSERYLFHGFGKYINNFHSPDSTELKTAENHAKEKEKGIWKFFTPDSTIMIDSAFAGKENTSVLTPDSTKLKNPYSSRPILLNIPLELVAGSAITLGTMLVGGGIGYLFDGEGGNGGWGGALIGLTAGYFIGFPWIIYEIAKSENPNLNPWINFGCSWGLTLVTGSIAALIKEGHHPINTIAVLSPIIGSLLYVNLISPQSPKSNDSLLKPEIPGKSFQDFRDSQTMKLELFRVNF